MVFSEELIDGVKVLHLNGKIMGGPETQEMRDRLDILMAGDTRFVVIDFQNVRWINSAGIGAIIYCLTTLRDRGGDVRFANLHGEILHYVQILNLGQIVKIFDDVDDAVASFKDING